MLVPFIQLREEAMRGFLMLAVVFLIAYTLCVPSASSDLPRLGARPIDSAVRDTVARWNPLRRLSRLMVVELHTATAELEALQ